MVPIVSTTSILPVPALPTRRSCGFPLSASLRRWRLSIPREHGALERNLVAVAFDLETKVVPLILLWKLCGCRHYHAVCLVKSLPARVTASFAQSSKAARTDTT